MEWIHGTNIRYVSWITSQVNKVNLICDTDTYRLASHLSSDGGPAVITPGHGMAGGLHWLTLILANADRLLLQTDRLERCGYTAA